MFIVFILIALLVFVLIVSICSFKGAKVLKDVTFHYNSIEFGFQGKGKTTLNCLMAHYTQKEVGYASNCDFGGDIKEKIKLNVINVGDNTNVEVIKGNIKRLEKHSSFEMRPIIIDDAGQYFGNWDEANLKKAFASTPQAVASWRQQYNSHIHFNIQRCGRLWKLLKEQCEVFILARGVIWLPFFAVIKFRYYDKLESAEGMLRPFKAPIGNKEAKALKVQYECMNGTIKDYFTIVPRKWLKFDSRYLHEFYFGTKAPTKKEYLIYKKHLHKSLKRGSQSRNQK